MSNKQTFGAFSYWHAAKFISGSALKSWREAPIPFTRRAVILLKAGAALEDVEKLQRIYGVWCKTTGNRRRRDTIPQEFLVG